MKLTRYLKPYLFYVIMAPLMMFVEVVMDLLQPTLMATVIDEGIQAGNLTVIWQTSLLMLLIAIVGVGGGMGCTYFASKASQNFGADLRKDLFDHVQTFSFAETDRFSSSSLVTRLTNDVQQIQNFVMMCLRGIIRTPLLFIGGIIISLCINIRFGVILAVVMPILFLVVFLIIRKASPLFLTVQKKIDRINAVMQENLTGVRVVKAYVREDYEKEKFYESNTDLTSVSLKVTRMMAFIGPCMTLALNATIIAVYLLGAGEIEAGTMEIGKVSAVVTYMSQILMSIMMLSMLFMMISRSKACADRIKEVFNTTSSITDPANALSASEKGGSSVSFKNVSFRYPTAVGEPVLADIDLDIRPGETLAILGATGSGKSSLVNLIGRFYDTTEGDILVDGVNVRDYSIKDLREKIGMVLQQATLFSGTILENIKWGKENATDEEAVRAAVTAQADGYIRSFKDGYQTMLGQGGLELSGGQKQRLSIARAIVRKPRILIMDDSTSALDMGTEARLRKALREELKDTTVILIAQRISSVMNADRIAVLDKGRIEALGTHDELMKTSDIYRDIYASQVGEDGDQRG